MNYHKIWATTKDILRRKFIAIQKSLGNKEKAYLYLYFITKLIKIKRKSKQTAATLV